MARGWEIFPCHSVVGGVCSCGDLQCTDQGKHPRTPQGFKDATTDLNAVREWFARWPDANWAVATGKRSGVVVIDLDLKLGVHGRDSLNWYCAENDVALPETYEVATGGGGTHLYFKCPDGGLGNRVGWLNNVDVRGDGGYVVLPGSSHKSGRDYALAVDMQIAALPGAMAQDISSRLGSADRTDWKRPDSAVAGFPEGERDDSLFRLACSLRRRLGDDRAAVEALILIAAANSTPPFPEKDALRKVEQAFQQDHSDDFDLSQVPFAAPEGDLYEFLRDLDPEMLRDVEKAVRARTVRDLAERVRREKRAAKYGDSAALDGAEFMFGEASEYVPIWGDGERLLWAEKGGLMIASDQGLGKSLTAQQIIAARLGIGPGDLLGLPVHPLSEDRSVVYLALDRPNQIARSMSRLFDSEAGQNVAYERLRVWTKPLPLDVLGDPFAFADWVQDTFGETVGDLVIDSVKDLTPANLSNGEVGQALDMAWKECRARGISTLILHHERKTGNDVSRANRQPALDNIYGSVWLTSGMDSVVHIQGKQGENVVTYSHLKHILEGLDPITAMHDQEHGRTEVLDAGSSRPGSVGKGEAIFHAIASRSARGETVTVAQIVGETGISQATVNRQVKALRDEGRIEEATPYDKATATPATYRAA
ncbi:bifunctional DNA primase/polymerase [Demequina zhanjiangensis]|uniref:Bifunctional DNA primase/polymerase n=1 Tax=Demequina zhanjiangensis TaxID=3051659 RepID=A0ABT8G359_9MICO|nr:bifunctional DNA primase/polymerase [Demequina sp. SYSU T00b26]MDN4473571.1 bifunctional DNA primase/polymerase [Demequina sp. SYSU T00b26]